MKYEVIIIGGGPAGLTAAYELEKNDIDFVLFEKNSTIGEPIHCGEGISKHIFTDFSIPIKGKSYPFIIKKHSFTKIHFLHHTIYGDVAAYMVKRDKFDQFLAERGNISDKIIHKKVIDAVRTKNGIVLKTNGNKTKNYTCNYLFIAEGSNGLISSRLGFSPPSPYVKGYEYKLKGEYADTIEFYFDAEKCPYGYFWIFPRDGESNIGVVTTANGIKSRLKNFIKSKNISLDGTIKKAIGGRIPMKGHYQMRLGDQTVLLLGDTGGFVNPLFYGGIRMAMLSGKTAVQALLSNRTNEKDLSTLYKNNLLNYSFSNKHILKCHEFFYSCGNEYLDVLGSLLDGSYINRISGWQTLSILFKLFRQFKLIKDPLGLFYLFRGFKLSRDWGF